MAPAAIAANIALWTFVPLAAGAWRTEHAAREGVRVAVRRTAMTAALLGAVLVGGLASAAPATSPPPGAVVPRSESVTMGAPCSWDEATDPEAVQITLGPNDCGPLGDQPIYGHWGM